MSQTTSERDRKRGPYGWHDLRPPRPERLVLERRPAEVADEAAGIALAERLESGTVGVNCYELDVAAPFGGVKASGLGRELGPEGMQAYLQPKTVYLAPTVLAPPSGTR